MQTSLTNPRLLKPNPWNTNSVSPQNMEKLTKSIRDLGFVTAVVVRSLPNGDLQILGGQHRVETAIHLDLKEVPIINVGSIDDVQAKKIGLVDNSRYGTDDTIGLAKLYEEIGLSAEELATFLPFTQVDFDTISSSVDINLDDLDLLGEDGDVPTEAPKSRPPKTHDVLRFRVTMADAEKIRRMIEETISSQGLADGDELTNAGSALSLLLLESSEEYPGKDD